MSGGATIWLTGLPASGKSTIAALVAAALRADGRACVVLDGDVLRRGLSADLGFSAEDRAEQARRAREIAHMLNQQGCVAIVALVSPWRADRESARRRHDGLHFGEVFVDCPLEVCQARDPKGLYRRAAAGELQGLTGFSAPYEPPLAPEVHARTSEQGPYACAAAVLQWLRP